MKSFEQICKEADQNKDTRYELEKLLDYIRPFEQMYDKSHYSFMVDHIKGYIDDIQYQNKKDKIKQGFSDY